MPQILNLDIPPALEKIVNEIVEASLPKLTAETWAQKLEANGLTVDQLAAQYVEALTNCKPSMKVKAIPELLRDLNVTKGNREVAYQPTIVINSDKVSLQQLILPERNY
jgi:hypothetical protein